MNHAAHMDHRHRSLEAINTDGHGGAPHGRAPADLGLPSSPAAPRFHRVVPADQLESAVQEEVEAIAKGGPIAIQEAKKLVRKVANVSEEEGFAYAEAKIAKLFASEEAAEGMKAFAEKRPPAWTQG